jgi:hypothetical protein
MTPHLSKRPERRVVPRRGLGRWSAAGVLVVASLAVTGRLVGITTTLNTEKIERAIEQSSLAQRGIRV